MAHATGTRLFASFLVFIGGITIVGTVVLWPAAYILWKKAEEIEAEREQEIDAINTSA